HLQDVIVKPLFGSMGLGMMRVTSEEIAFRVFRTLETIRGVYYVQRTVDHDGCDVRAFVVGGRVVGAIERSAAGWKTNLARGGRARATTLSRGRTDLALRAARAVGAEYAGVDLLPARDGTDSVVEGNGIPGWRGLQEATSGDVGATIVPPLLAPLARAALIASADGAALRTAVAATLRETTVADAQEVYAAIRQGRPGGLGRAPQQDVAGTPTVTLREAMALAAERDAIARE